MVVPKNSGSRMCRNSFLNRECHHAYSVSTFIFHYDFTVTSLLFRSLFSQLADENPIATNHSHEFPSFFSVFIEIRAAMRNESIVPITIGYTLGEVFVPNR